MTRDDTIILADHLFNKASQELFETNVFYPEVVMVFGKEFQAAKLFDLYKTLGKDEVFRLIGLLCQRLNPDSVFFITESFMLIADEETEKEVYENYGSVKDHPDRVECLMLGYVDATEGCVNVKTGYIETNNKAKFVQEGEWLNSTEFIRFLGLEPWR